MDDEMRAKIAALISDSIWRHPFVEYYRQGIFDVLDVIATKGEILDIERRAVEKL